DHAFLSDRKSARPPARALRKSPSYTEDVKIRCAAPLIMILLAGCSNPPGDSFDSTAEQFVLGALALSPVAATQSGYHQHKGVRLDETLDDFSPQGIAAQRQFYTDFSARLAKWNAGSLTAEQQADLQIMNDQIALGLLEL